MIQAMIFDLDGTLVQTERLKARSYARAAVELCPRVISEEEVIEAYKRVVGHSRREVAQALIDQFNLGAKAAARMAAFGVATPWEAFVAVRLRYYEAMVADPAVVRAHQWPYRVALLQQARQNHCKIALATTSRRKQALHILRALALDDAFDVIATADDVTRTKPDPEIYHLVLGALDAPPPESLAIEDSPAGVAAARAAGVWCIAVTTDFTRKALHRADLLAPRWIVDDPKNLMNIVQELIDEQAGD